jgi:hypothetical protein
LGFVPRENIMGQTLLNYRSFKAQDGELEKTGLGTRIARMGHVAQHFFKGTRWKRTLARVK